MDPTDIKSITPVYARNKPISYTVLFRILVTQVKEEFSFDKISCF